MPRLTLLPYFALLASLVSQEAVGCIPPAPQLQLDGESDEDFLARSRIFSAAELDEDRRRYQTVWYDFASRISLARITRTEQTPIILSDGLSRTRRVEAVRLGLFKGDPVAGGTVAMQDAGVTTCGYYGGGTATMGKAGDYIVMFENVQKEGTGHVGLLLRNLREPRLIAQFSTVVQSARKAASTVKP